MIKFPNFMKEAACRSEDPEIFFPSLVTEEGLYRYQEALPIARNICSSCEVFSKCFDWAIAHEEYGIWAGTTPKEREEYRSEHKIKIDNPFDSWDWYELFKNDVPFKKERKSNMICCDTPREDLNPDVADLCYNCIDRYDDYLADSIIANLEFYDSEKDLWQ